MLESFLFFVSLSVYSLYGWILCNVPLYNKNSCKHQNLWHGAYLVFIYFNFFLVCFCFLFWPLGGRDWQWLWTAKPIFSHGFKAAFTIYHPYIFILQQTNDFEFQRQRYIDLHVSNHLTELFCGYCHLLFNKILEISDIQWISACLLPALYQLWK